MLLTAFMKMLRSCPALKV